MASTFLSSSTTMISRLETSGACSASLPEVPIVGFSIAVLWLAPALLPSTAIVSWRDVLEAHLPMKRMAPLPLVPLLSLFCICSVHV